MAANDGIVCLGPFEPVFKVLFGNHQLRRCNDCFRQRPLLIPCLSCVAVVYCNEECRIRDARNGHALECGSPTFRFCNENAFKKDLVDLFRLYARNRSDPLFLSRLHPQPDGSALRFEDLPIRSRYSNSVVARRICTELAHQLMRIEDPAVNVNRLIRLYNMFNTNALDILEGNALIGKGIFVLRLRYGRLQNGMDDCVFNQGRFEIWVTNAVISAKSIKTHETIPGLPELQTVQQWCEATWPVTPRDYGIISKLSAKMYNQMTDFVPGEVNPGFNAQKFTRMFESLIAMLEELVATDGDLSVITHMAHYAMFAQNLGMPPAALRRLRVDVRRRINCSINKFNLFEYEHVMIILRQ